MQDRLHHHLPLLSLSTHPTSQTADGTYDLDDLLAEAEALLAEPVPPDDDSAARVAFEERLDRVRLRLRMLPPRRSRTRRSERKNLPLPLPSVTSKTSLSPLSHPTRSHVAPRPP